MLIKIALKIGFNMYTLLFFDDWHLHNRINLDRSRTFYSEDEVTQQSDKDFLVNNIVSIKDKSFKNVVSVLMNNDMVKVVKEF